MKKIIPILTVVFVAACFYQCTSEERILKRALLHVAAELNAATPVMLDEYTRFDRAEVIFTPERVFRYHYTIVNTLNPDSLLQSWLHQLKETTRTVYFTAPEMAIFRENGIVIEYVYSDESGRVIQTIRITPEDYN